MEYNHKQIGTVIIVPMIILFFVVIMMSPTNKAIQSILVVVVLVFIAVLALFYSLNVEIKNNTIICRFGIGLIQKHIPLSEIQAANTVQNPWWIGWGIRWIPGRYWLWNVSGFQAVELTYKDGHRFRIGTDEPEALLNAIKKNLTFHS
jgi:hypothetical protein